MNENKASLTALISAFGRAFHSLNESPKIFDDFLARNMFSDDEYAFFSQSMAQLLSFSNPERAALCEDQKAAIAQVLRGQSGSITLSRARYTEGNLKDAVKEGILQYVILGAGMDTFAFRHPELMELLEVFELDHPATQASKKERIEKQGWCYPEKLHFVPVDFSNESMAETLKASAYDSEKSGFFSWLGVTYYLSRKAIFDTLKSIADISPKGSTIIFDYLHSDAFIPEKAAEKVKLMQKLVGNAGEPMKTGFEPSRLAGELEELGLRLKENLSPSEIEERYFSGRTDGYHAFPQIYFAKAEVI